ncbi:hypothetical protein STANM309S_04529 [Streptomyces tanashiensis]
MSVAALVRRAGVGRATFYLHYADLEALAVDACADIVREAVDALHAWRGTPDPESPPPALLAFFERIAPHAALYRELLRPGGSGPLGLVLHQDLRARSRSERALVGAPDPDLVASAVAATFARDLADWLHSLIDASPSDPRTASGASSSPIALRSPTGRAGRGWSGRARVTSVGRTLGGLPQRSQLSTKR